MTLPATFPELLRESEIPVERAALVIARDAYPQLDVDEQLARIDALAAPLAPRIARCRTVQAQAASLGTYVYDELGFRGDEETYYDPRNSYLNDVIVRRMGIPISLAVVLIAIGTRAGLTVEGVGFPGHFLVRLGGSTGIYLDPFFRARTLSREALERLLRRALGDAAHMAPEHLAPVSTRAIVARMLTNLKAVYESRKEHARALVVCDRLVDLSGSPEMRRDRGAHAIALGAMGAGIEDYERYLLDRPDAGDAAKIRARLAELRSANQRDTRHAN
jgi:regulator of sirC expression with transglutaminase-like and TPR domain